MLATYTLDEAADWLLGIALAVFVFDRTGSALAVAGVLIASRFGPSLVITPLSGRLSTTRLGAALGGLYLAAAAIALILAASTAAPLPVLYLLTFGATTCAATARVLTRTAACNVLDGHGMLREGAAALNVSYGAVNVLGPAVAGAATAIAGPHVGLVAACVLFLGLTAMTWNVVGTAAGGDADDAPETASARESLALLASGPGIAAVLLASAALLVLFTMDEPIMLPYVEESLDGTPSQYAALLTAWGVGLLAGGGAFALLRRWSMIGTFVVASALLTGAYLALGAAASIPVALVACAVGGIGNGMFWGALTVVTLEAVPPSLRAQMSGVIESVALAAPGVGYLLGGGLSELLSPAHVYTLAGVAGAGVVAALGVALARPRSRRVAVPTPALATVASPTPQSR